MAATETKAEAPPLRAEGLSRTHPGRRGEAVRALAGFDLTLAVGDVVALLGPNGSGKTTAIHLLLGLIAADAGRVELFGRPPEERSARSRLGYLAEETELLPFLSARETLELHGHLHGMDGPSRRQRAAELLDRLGLAHAGRRRVGSFSKGMARRLAFGQAVLHSPALLVLDEVTSGLDPEGADVVFEVLRAERDRGTAVLFTTHLLAEAETQADRLVILVGGRVAAAGTLEELLGPDARREAAHRTSLERLFRGLLAEGEPGDSSPGDSSQ